MRKETENENLNTAYDDAYHTLLNDCPQLIIPVVNLAFNESYGIEEEVTRLNGDYYISTQKGRQKKRVADSNFQIRDHIYHIECQSTIDRKMILRVFEYDAQAALQTAVLENDVLTVEFPHAAILYLRHNANTPDSITIRVKVPGAECAYKVPVIKTQRYTVDELFEKKLYFLLPFHIFSYEKQFEAYDADGERLEKLKMVYRDIIERLDARAKMGEITEYTKRTIIAMMQKVLQKITTKYEKVEKGIGEIMGGKILNYEAKDILNQGRAEGKAEDVLELLQEIGTIAEELQKRILDERNLEVLRKWHKLAARSTTVEEFAANM